LAEFIHGFNLMSEMGIVVRKYRNIMLMYYFCLLSSFFVTLSGKILNLNQVKETLCINLCDGPFETIKKIVIVFFKYFNFSMTVEESSFYLITT